jgi:transposase
VLLLANYPRPSDIKRSSLSELANTLLVLREQISKLEKAIGKGLKDIPETNILKSIPGVGNITTARFLGEIGSVDNFKDDDVLVLYVGLGLLPDKSGKRGRTKKTFRFNRHTKYAIMQMASCSIRHNPDSLAFYQTSG